MHKSLCLLCMIIIPLCVAVGQETRIDQLENRIQELEQRIILLEMKFQNQNVEQTSILGNNSFEISNWRKIRVGMVEDEVRGILGEPSHISRYSSNFYVWQYSVKNGSGYVRFNDRGVYSWDEPY